MTMSTERRLPSLPPPLVSPMVSRPTRPPRPEEAAKPHSKAAGRFGVLNEFVDCSLEGLTRAELVVWLILYRDTRDGTVRTAQADIARRGGICRRAVQKAMRRLENWGCCGAFIGAD